MERAIPQNESLETGFVTAEETAALTQIFELALKDVSQVAGGIPAVCVCGCCVPVPRHGPIVVYKM